MSPGILAYSVDRLKTSTKQYPSLECKIQWKKQCINGVEYLVCIAAITNYYKLSGLNNTHLLSHGCVGQKAGNSVT